MTLRQKRRTALSEIPVGSDFASGRWVAKIGTMPAAGPRRTRSSAIATSSSP